MQPTRDLRLTGSVTMQLGDVGGHPSGCLQPGLAELLFDVLAPILLELVRAEDLLLQFCENSQKSRHGPATRRGDIECLCQGNESNPEFVEFFQIDCKVGSGTPPTIQTPNENDIGLLLTSQLHQALSFGPVQRARTYLSDNGQSTNLFV